MGTYVTITVYDENKEKGTEAIDNAFQRIFEIEDRLSNFIESSEVSQLNIDKELLNPSDEIRENLEKSVYYGQLSEGAFDITVQPILDLYIESFGVNKRAPNAEEIEEELKKVDYQEIIIEESKISLGREQKITLGGIAKGYAVDEAVEILKEKGIRHALVNAGGDMRAIGLKYGGTEWNIALANPRNKKDYITTVNINDKAIVTSGDYERYFDENKSFHHIVDPRTGYSATELMSVTIIAESAFDADAISTSVFVLGKEKGMELIESIDNVEGILITREKKILKSSCWE